MRDEYPYLIQGHMYQYDLHWVIENIKNIWIEIDSSVELHTIKYADPIQWDITTQYQANTVVVDPKTGTAYISTKPVPSGILLTDTNYWTVVFNFQKVYTDIMKNISAHYVDGKTSTFDLKTNELVWFEDNLYYALHDINIGDALVPDANIKKTTVEDMLKISFRENMLNFMGGNRTTTLDNDILNVSGDWTVQAGDITETANNITMHSTRDMLLDADGNLTEQVTGGKTSEVGGTYIGKFGSASFETEAPSWKVKFPSKTVDLADIDKKPERNFWLIGDSYGNTYHPDTQTYTDGWCKLLAENLLPSFPFANNIYVDFQGGAGFSGGSSTFATLITEWIKKYDDITDVVICAGRNDFFESTDKINSGMLAVASVIKAKFPNVRLYVGMIGYDLNTTEITNNKFYAAVETTINYKNGASLYGYIYLTNVESILHNTDLMRTDDGKHPNDKGASLLAEGIFQALQGACNVGYPLRTCNISITNGTVQKGSFREILNNTTIFIINAEGVNLVFTSKRTISCNPETYTELLGTVDFKYFNGYEYGLTRIPCDFVYSNDGVYETASGYVAFEGHKLYVAILKINEAKNNFDEITIDSLQIMPFSTQYTF